MAKKATRVKEKKVEKEVTELETYALVMGVIEEGDVSIREEDIEEVTRALLEALDETDGNDERVTKEMSEWFNAEAEKRGLFKEEVVEQRKEIEEEIEEEIKEKPGKRETKEEKTKLGLEEEDKKELKVTRAESFCNGIRKGGTREEIIEYMNKNYGGSEREAEFFFRNGIAILLCLEVVNKQEEGRYSLIK